MMTDENYKEKKLIQLETWVNGTPEHDFDDFDIDGECVPDFSCCQPDFIQPLAIRETYMEAYKQDKEDIWMPMMYGFLGAAMAKYEPKKKIHIAGAPDTTLN